VEILSSVDTYNLLSAPGICNIITKQEYSRWGLTQIYCLYSYHVYVYFAWGECTDKIIMKYTMCETKCYLFKFNKWKYFLLWYLQWEFIKFSCKQWIKVSLWYLGYIVYNMISRIYSVYLYILDIAEKLYLF